MYKTWLSSILNTAILKISLGQTNTHTHTHNDYYNTRCACAPRVNKLLRAWYYNRKTQTLLVDCAKVLYMQALMYVALVRLIVVT